jgi:fatty acid synthase subunit alpha
MGKKTANKKYHQQDQLRLLRREFLSYSDDYARICYEFDKPQSPPPGEPSKQQVPPAASSTPPVATEIPKPEPALVAHRPAVVPVQDSPLSAGDIVLALTAQKLKQPFDQVPTEKSIRELSGGKSK